MTVQLTKAQIDQLKVVLAPLGLDVKAMPKARKASDMDAAIARVKAMPFKTGSIKTAILRSMRWRKEYGPLSEAKMVRYWRIPKGETPQCNDPAVIAAFFAELEATA